MRRKQTYAYYCALVVPLGTLAGIGIGRATGLETLSLIVGTGVGLAAAYLLLLWTAPDEMP